jgi:hypothetical protein
MSRSSPFSASALLIAALAVVAVLLVAASLERPELATYAPTPPEPIEVEEALVGPITYTVDASDPQAWRFFDFSKGSIVERPGALGWDLAIRRFNLIVNGGEGFAGAGGVADLGPVPFDSVRAAPGDGYEPTLARRDSVNAALARWYTYGFASHLLRPKPRVYAIRTADGRFAKLEILSYYCPGALPGCLTFRYVYQGAGGTDLSGGEAPGSEQALRSRR